MSSPSPPGVSFPATLFERVRGWFSTSGRDAQAQQHLEKLRQQTPVPVFWLFGKTQSGKTSLIKYLTGATDAEIGEGFRPCTRFSRQYQFPVAEAPLITFLDTRGLDEPDYNPREDLDQFDPLAHVLVVTVKVLDHAQENVLENLRVIRRSRPSRPVVLALTCLHEAYPFQQHPEPYAFQIRGQAAGIRQQGSGIGDSREVRPDPQSPIPDPLIRSLDEQSRRFRGLVDVVVPIDLTQPVDGFKEPNYGGDQLKQVLLDVLPAAYRQTLLTLEEATRDLQDLYARHALPHIVGYSMLAASAGAIPVPWIDLLILPVIQTRMIYHLARFYGQPLSATRFLELASTLGLGMLVRQASREIMKLIPYVGSVAGGALAGSSTFALGKAFCFYFSAVHEGHVPKAEEVRRYYQDQLTRAGQAWTNLRAKAGEPTLGSGNGSLPPAANP
jgi:uncharacterized protein (DUF697 family)